MPDPLRLVCLVSGGGTTLQNLLDRAADGSLPARVVGVVSSNANAFGVERALRVGVSALVELRGPGFADRVWAAVRTFAPEIEALQTSVDEKAALRIRLDERRKRAALIEDELKEVLARSHKLSTARAELLRRQQEIEEWRGLSEEITREMDTFGTARQALAGWDAAAAQHVTLREEFTRLKEIIDVAAAGLRQQLETCEACIAHEISVVASSEATLAGGETIFARAGLLKATRESEATFAARHTAFDSAQQVWREADDALRVARLEHESAFATLQRQLQNALEYKAHSEALEPQLAAAEASLMALAQATLRQEELQREGLKYDSDLAHLKKSCEDEKRAVATNEGKLKVLAENPDAECPLCHSGLGEHGREHIESSITEAIAAGRARIETMMDEGRQLRRKKQSLEMPMRETGKLLRDGPRFNADAARLSHALEEARAQAASLPQLQQQLEAARSALENGAFSPNLARVANDAKASLDFIGYDRRAHEALVTEIAALAPVEREVLALDHARELKAKAEAALAELGPKRERLQRELEAGAFAGEAHTELTRVRKEADNLGYTKDARENHRAARALWESLQNAPVRWDRLQNELAQSDRVKAQIADNALAASEAEAGIERLKKETAAQGDVTLQLAACERGLQESQTQLAQLRADERESRTELGKQQQALDELTRRETERATLADERKEKAREAFVLTQTAKAFGKDGIQALIIENAIPEIQDDANAILRRLTRNEMQISLESQRGLQSGGTRETLDIKISDDKGTREYLLYSGGEAFRADFALRIALSKLLARRAGTQLRTLIIDEGFGTQDSEGLQNMIECIQTIAEDFSKVLVVTHLETIKNAFPTRIEVFKDASTGSHYQVISD